MIELVTVAVVLPVAPAVALTPSQTAKPPPLPDVVPASDRSAMPVRFAFACALNAAAAESLSRATAWTTSVFGTVVVTPVTETAVLAGVLTPPP